MNNGAENSKPPKRKKPMCFKCEKPRTMRSYNDLNFHNITSHPRLQIPIPMQIKVVFKP